MTDKYEPTARVINIAFLLHNEAEIDPGTSFLQLTARASHSMHLYVMLFATMDTLSILDSEDKEYVDRIKTAQTPVNLKSFQDWMIIDAYMRRLKYRKRAEGENNYGR